MSRADVGMGDESDLCMWRVVVFTSDRDAIVARGK